MREARSVPRLPSSGRFMNKMGLHEAQVSSVPVALIRASPNAQPGKGRDARAGDESTRTPAAVGSGSGGSSPGCESRSGWCGVGRTWSRAGARISTGTTRASGRAGQRRQRPRPADRAADERSLPKRAAERRPRAARDTKERDGAWGREHGPSIIPTRTEPCRAGASLLRCSRGFFLTADPNANSTGGSFLR